MRFFPAAVSARRANFGACSCATAGRRNAEMRVLQRFPACRLAKALPPVRGRVECALQGRTAPFRQVAGLSARAFRKAVLLQLLVQGRAADAQDACSAGQVVARLLDGIGYGLPLQVICGGRRRPVPSPRPGGWHG